MSSTDMYELTKRVNSFCQLQEEIGNIVTDVKISSCDTTCEAVVIWQLIAETGVDVTIGQKTGGQMYDVCFVMEDVEYTIHTERTDIVQCIIDRMDIFTGCEVVTSDENGDKITIYTRLLPDPQQLKIPKR